MVQGSRPIKHVARLGLLNRVDVPCDACRIVDVNAAALNARLVPWSEIVGLPEVRKQHRGTQQTVEERWIGRQLERAGDGRVGRFDDGLRL